VSQVTLRTDLLIVLVFKSVTKLHLSSDYTCMIYTEVAMKIFLYSRLHLSCGRSHERFCLILIHHGLKVNYAVRAFNNRIPFLSNVKPVTKPADNAVFVNVLIYKIREIRNRAQNQNTAAMIHIQT
jgi:hypothetical protein